MTSVNRYRCLGCVLVAALSTMAARGATAPDEHVDRLTQAALSLDAHPDHGAVLYKENCAGCHGATGFGDPDKGIPVLAGQRFAYVVRQLANFSGEERDSSTMHRVVSRRAAGTPQAWVDIAVFLNAAPADKSQQQGDGKGVALGRGIFQEQCASCHGADAGGDADGFVPALRHQHYGYLAEQMKKLGSGYRHNVDEDLVLFLRSFDAAEIDATADYLSRLEGPRTDRKHMRDDGLVVD